MTKELEQLKETNESLLSIQYKLADSNTKLRQTLTEIKEIAEKHAPRCNDYANCDYECEECHLSDLKQILQKISEVENEHNG